MIYPKQVCEPSVCSFYRPWSIKDVGDPQKPVRAQLASTAYKPHSPRTHLNPQDYQHQDKNGKS